MKRLLYITIIFLFLIGISSIAFAAPSANYVSGGYELDPPRRFDAVGFQYYDTADPFNQLQNMMEFKFVNGSEIHKDYTVTLSENEQGGPAELTLSMDVTYQRELAETFSSKFITGTYTFRQDSNGVIVENTGMVNGSIVFILPENMGISDPDLEVPAILLQFISTDNSQWAWYAYLDTPNDDFVCYVGSNVDLIMNSDYMDHESRPHLPSVWNQVEVAAGVGISTIGIAIINALTKTTTFGNASFNGSFDPASPPAAPTPTAPTPSAQAAASGSTGGSAGGFIGTLKNFFKGLFASLRDMLVDEGRSFASGKLSESLGEAGIDIDIGDAGDGGD